MENFKKNTTKNILRKKALEMRKSLAQSGKSKKDREKIIKNILSLPDFLRAKNIALYFPIKNEIDLLGFLDPSKLPKLTEVKNKNYYFPCCKKSKDNTCQMEFKKFNENEGFETGLYNIKEPKGKVIDPKILDIIFVPALMMNKKGFRLGYGGGYYDRFFCRYPNLKAKKIAIIQTDFISDEFVEESFDIQMDYAITETGAFRLS